MDTNITAKYLILMIMFSFGRKVSSTTTYGWCSMQSEPSLACKCLSAINPNDSAEQSLTDLCGCLGIEQLSPPIVSSAQVNQILQYFVWDFGLAAKQIRSDNCQTASVVMKEVSVLWEYLPQEQLSSSTSAVLMASLTDGLLAYECNPAIPSSVESTTVQSSSSSAEHKEDHINEMHEDNEDMGDDHESFEDQGDHKSSEVNHESYHEDEHNNIHKIDENNEHHSDSHESDSHDSHIEDEDAHKSVHEYPNPQDFISYIMNKFGIPEGKPMSMEVFEEMLLKLGLGEIEQGEHSNHLVDHSHEHHNDHESNEDQEDHEMNESHELHESHESHNEHLVDKAEVHVHGNRKRRHTHNTIADIEQCLSSKALFRIHGSEAASGVSRSQLRDICPSLLQQQLSGACSGSHNHHQHDNLTYIKETMDVLQTYGYATLAVILISLCSILGVFFHPCIDKPVYKYIMAVFVATAVGTMCGDAVLHLIPTAFGVHGGHSSEHNHHAHEKRLITIEPYFYKALVIIGAVYIFYIMESVMSMFGHGHHHNDQENLACNQTQSNEENIYAEPDLERDLQHFTNTLQGQLYCSSISLSSRSSSINTILPKNKDKKPIKSMAWMVIIGDAIHNFADGLAIGAAFSQSLHSGFSTSIAAVCHELPHEIGDFAVLVNSGMSVGKALLFNLLSSLSSLAGLYIGLTLASGNELVRDWIFTSTAGMFLYVSLTDMLPELMQMQKDGKQRGKRTLICIFALQNAGYLLGIGAMATISLFEHSLESIISGV